MHSRAAVIFFICIGLASLSFADPPKITYRLESDAIYTGPAEGSLVRDYIYWGIPEWDEAYVQELRVFLSGVASHRATYRIEPRFAFTYHDSIPDGKFDWVLDQAYGSLSFGDRSRLTVGKQRIRWGTGMTFTPTDRWQPSASTLDPTRYLEGAFLFRYDAYLPFLSFSGIYSPNRPNVEYGHDSDEAYGFRIFKLVGTTDLYLSATRAFSDDETKETNIGAAFAWDSGPAVVYGEGAALHLDRGTLQHLINWQLSDKWEPRVVLGMSKRFSTSSAFYVEGFYNGWGLSSVDYDELITQIRRWHGVLRQTPISPDFVIPFREFTDILGPARSLHQWYTAGNGTFIYRQLWSLSGNTIFEPIDNTIYLYPIISYLGFENVDLMLGYSSVFGGSSSEKVLLPSHHNVDARFIIHF